MTKSKKKQNNIDSNLIKELLERASGQDLFGRDGFFQQLKQSLANGMLEGEIEHHLGYEKHNKSPKPDANRRNGHYTQSI